MWSDPPKVHPFIALAGGRRNSCRRRACWERLWAVMCLFLGTVSFSGLLPHSLFCGCVCLTAHFAQSCPSWASVITAHSSTAEQPWDGWDLWNGKPVSIPPFSVTLLRNPLVRKDEYYIFLHRLKRCLPLLSSWYQASIINPHINIKMVGCRYSSVVGYLLGICESLVQCSILQKKKTR